MLRELRPAITLLLLLTILTGMIYPFTVTVIAQGLMPAQANGSMLADDAGSALIGQSFEDPAYFWSRLSATSPVPYNAAASSGANLGVNNPALADSLAARADALRDANASAGVSSDDLIPVDLLTSSASGLDPDISPAAAYYQAARVAALRGLDEAAVRALIDAHITHRQFGFLGEPRVNVLPLNLALDALN